MIPKKAPPETLQYPRYGGLLPRHASVVERHRGDPDTVLGNYRGMRTLPPPPVRTELVVELNEIVQRQAQSTPDEREFAVRVDSERNHYVLWSDEVERLTGVRRPPSFFDGIASNAEGFLMDLKGRFDRARPYQVAPLMGKRVEFLVTDPRTPSYPSGHAFEAYLFALTVEEMHPRHSFEFFALADMVADSRIVAGVHYPSDIVAGRSAAVIAHAIRKDMGL
jgi:acid phosphatase (class A)